MICFWQWLVVEPHCPQHLIGSIVILVGSWLVSHLAHHLWPLMVLIVCCYQQVVCWLVGCHWLVVCQLLYQQMSLWLYSDHDKTTTASDGTGMRTTESPAEVTVVDTTTAAVEVGWPVTGDGLVDDW